MIPGKVMERVASLAGREVESLPMR
jgi:hypothetical protein